MEVAEELRAEHDALAQAGPRGEEVADVLLGGPVGVDVGGVHDVAAAVEILGENCLGGFGARAPAPVLAEGHRAESEWADAQTRAAERDVGVERGHGPDDTTASSRCGR